MQIQKTKDQHLEVKTKNASIIFDGVVHPVTDESTSTTLEQPDLRSGDHPSMSSRSRHSGNGVKINDVELEGSGDYEVADVIVEGVDDYIYIFKLEDIVVGSVNFRGEISKENVNKLSNADLLIVSLNGGSSKSIDQINNIETNATIYTGSAASRETLKKAGISAEEIENLKFSKADFAGDQKTYFIETSSNE